MIYKEVIDTITDILGRFKGVEVVKYQSSDKNNAQHSEKVLQAYVDSATFTQYLITKNLCNLEVEIYILGHLENQGDRADVLEIQDKAYNCALNVIAKINYNKQTERIITLYDFSILTLEDYTAQRNAGVKVSLVLTIPNGVDLCTLDDNFGDPIEPDPDEKVDLYPIDLPITIKC